MDQAAFHFINIQIANPALDMAMALLSNWDVWWPMAVAVGAVALTLGGFRARAMLLTAVLAIGMSDGLICRTLKDVAGRPRPNDSANGVRTVELAKATPRILALAKPLRLGFTQLKTPTKRGKSFPSSHAANCFALATVVCVFYRRRGWIAFLPAGLVAFSRMYVGVHWPVDVLAGCLIGTACGLGTIFVLKLLWKRYGARVMPGLHAAHPDFTIP